MPEPESSDPRPIARGAAWCFAAALAALALVLWLRPPAWAALLAGLAIPLLAVVPLARRVGRLRRTVGLHAADRASDADRLRRLDDQARWLRDLLEAVDAPVVAADEAGTVVVCNAAAAALVGPPAERLVGRPVGQVFTQADIVRLHEAARAGHPVHEQVRFSAADGARTLEVSAIPLPGAPGATPAEAGSHPVVLTLRDVTELDRAVQVKSDFVANASHELRTPIAALKAAVETLTGGAAEDAPMRRRLVEMIAANTDRLDEMVRDLLDISRLESPDARVQISPVSPRELVAVLGPMFERVAAERDLSIRFHFQPELEALETDRNLLVLILKNLIENSTKFAYPGTEILVTGAPIPSPPAAAGKPAPGRPRRGARFEVIDRGVGVPLAHQTRIFERYYQVDSARTGSAPRRGTGLGLSIVKHAVRSLGGTVRISSVWKEGTTMTVELPGCLPDLGIRDAGGIGRHGQSSGR